jgi:hypothetical protein
VGLSRFCRNGEHQHFSDGQNPRNEFTVVSTVVNA